jgi:phosphate transport system substrate-binding protein
MVRRYRGAALLRAAVLLALAGTTLLLLLPARAQEAAQVPFNTIRGHLEGQATELKGTGGTFPAALYKVWFAAYSSTIGVNVTYDALGSGTGINRIINREVDFAGSDAPMTAEQMRLAKGGEVLHIPTAFGAITLVYQVPGLKGRLRLRAQDIAGIYLGDITRWDDPRLTANNPQLAGMHQGIIVVHRADGSGSTYGFTDYLSAIDPAWLKRSSQGISVTWPVGIGAPGGGGVVDMVQSNPYAIGYVELGLAVKNRLSYALVQNAAGQWVEPTLNSIVAAVGAIGQRRGLSVVNAPGADSYPICTGTWLLVYKNMPDRAKAVALTRLLWWAIHDGQAVNNSPNYAVVPSSLRAQSEQAIRQIVSGGVPAFPGH